MKLLAVSPERFSKDLEELDRYLNITRIPKYLQYKAYRTYLHSFLELYLKRFDALLCPSIYYKQDLPWAKLAKKIGIPTIVIQQDLLLASKNNIIHKEQEVFKKVLDFWPNLLIVYNQTANDMLAEVFPDDQFKIVIGGMPRMEKLWREIRRTNRITFFSFWDWWDNKGQVHTAPLERNQLWESVHSTLVQLASDYPEIEVIIKCKWEKLIYDIMVNVGDIPENCIITHKGDPLELIKSSSVVIASGSTTVLESQLLNKPILLLDYGMPEGMSSYVDLPHTIRIQNEEHLKKEILRHISTINKKLYERYLGSVRPARTCAGLIQQEVYK